MTEQKRVFTYAVGLTSQRDKTFIAYSIESPCFTFIAKTEEKVISQAEAALEFYVRSLLDEY